MFPGESEIDQLYVIQKIIGPLPPEQIHLFNLNPRFRGLKFPTEIKPLTLRHKYQHNLPADLLEFLESSLRLEARKRLNIDQCSSHRAFKQFHQKKDNSNHGNSDAETEESWKEIELEDPTRAVKDEVKESTMKIVPKAIGNDIQEKASKERRDCQVGKREDLQAVPNGNYRAQTSEEKQTFNRKQSRLEDKTTREDASETSSKPQSTIPYSDAKMTRDLNCNKTIESRPPKDISQNKTVNSKRMSNNNDFKLDMSALTKQFGKFNKPNLSHATSNTMISASKMNWSIQSGTGYSNAGQRTLQPKSSYGQYHVQNQVCFDSLTLKYHWISLIS